jgi:hypothetical protein
VRRFRHRFHRPGTQAPLFDPQHELIPWPKTEAGPKVFRDSDLAFAADGHDPHLHWKYYSKTGGSLAGLGLEQNHDKKGRDKRDGGGYLCAVYNLLNINHSSKDRSN